MVADGLGTEPQLGKADLVPGAGVLKVGEIFPRSAQRDLEGLDARLQLGTADSKFGHTRVGLRAFLLPESDALGEARGLGFQRTNSFFMSGDVAFPCRYRLGELPQPGLHRSPLARQGVLTLALGGDTEARLGQVTRRGGLSVAQEGNPGGRCGAFIACRGEFSAGDLQLLLTDGDLFLKADQVLIQGTYLRIKALVAVADILQLPAGKQMICLGRGKQSLRVSEMLACIALADDRRLERGQRPLAHQGEPGRLFPEGLDLALQGSDLGPT